MVVNERVTPVLGKLIENIMAERPADPAQYIVRYLTKSDSMAASAAHWDELTAQLADTKKAPAAQPEDDELHIPIESFKAISSALDPFEAQHPASVPSAHAPTPHASRFSRDRCMPPFIV